MRSESRAEVFHTVLLIALIFVLLALSIWVLKPFIPALLWATMTVVATWPILIAVQRRVKGKRWIATTVMTVAMLLVFAVPLLLTIGTIVRHVDDITGWANSFAGVELGEPPAWVTGLPMIGPELDSAWREAGSGGHLGEKLQPYFGRVVGWFVTQIGSFGAVLLQFLLTLAMSAVLYFNGEKALAGVVAAARRLGDERAVAAVRLAGQAIRAVAVGVIVTALVQSTLGGIGLAVAGVPLAVLLTAIMFLLAVAQVGAVPVMVCAVIWLYVRGENGWGTALLVWTVIVGSMDNVLRPILIRRGADLPLLLVFAGVVGGLIAFGLVGLFIGPMLLAVTWTLSKAWVAGETIPPEPLPKRAAKGAAKSG